MKNKILTYTCALSFVFAPSLSLASQGIETVGVAPSVKDSSDKAKDSNQMGQIMSYLTAGVLAAESAKHFSACPPHHYSQCAMGALKAAMAALSMMQGQAHGKTSAGAGLTSFLTDGSQYNPVKDPYGLDNPNNPLLQDPDFRALKGNIAKLENCVAGSCVNLKNGTIKTADGKSYKISDFASNESMAAAGLPQAAIDGASAYNDKLSKLVQDKMDKLKLGAQTAATGFDEGGGGGSGGGGYGSDSASDGSDATAYAGGGAGNVDRDPSSLAGMQKNYNGEPIGVAADSIFLMMTRRYKVKESQDSFFTDAELALKNNLQK